MKNIIIIAFITVIIFFSLFGVIAHIKIRQNEKYEKQMKENAERFHEEAVKARQEDLKAGQELQEKYDKEFWSNAKDNDSQN